WFRKSVEAARRGEVPVTAAEPPPPIVPTAAIGQPAPDFVATDYTSNSTARFRRFFGKPILLVFYTPNSPTSQEVLRFAETLHETMPGITVVGMAVSPDRDKVLKERDDMGLKFSILSGQGLKMTFGVEGTPKLYVLDADGVLRGGYVGWGRETPNLAI